MRTGAIEKREHRNAHHGERSDSGGLYPVGAGLKPAPTRRRNYCAKLDHLIRHAALIMLASAGLMHSADGKLRHETVIPAKAGIYGQA